jgi:hypothetical protein
MLLAMAASQIEQARSAPVQSCYCPNCEAMGKELAALKAQPVQEPVALDVTLDGEEAKLLRDMLGDDRDELSPVRLLVGNGHSGHGLYAAHAEYQEEGAVLLAAAPPAAQPAPLQPVVAWLLTGSTEVFHASEFTPDAENNQNGEWTALGPINTPPAAQRQWVGLTDEERVDLWKATETDNRMVLIDAIEAKLKEKNGG